jgi:hypothetical protein
MGATSLLIRCATRAVDSGHLVIPIKSGNEYRHGQHARIHEKERQFCNESNEFGMGLRLRSYGFFNDIFR